MKFRDPPSERSKDDVSKYPSSFSSAAEQDDRLREAKAIKCLDEALHTSFSSSSVEPTTPAASVTRAESDSSKLGALRRFNVKFMTLPANSPSTSALENDTKATTIEKPPKVPGILVTNSTPSANLSQQQTSSNTSSAGESSSSLGVRSRFSSIKSRTIDSPDMSSSGNNSEATTTLGNLHGSATQLKSSTSLAGGGGGSSSAIGSPPPALLNSSGKPLQSILRRSETPPNASRAGSKSLMQQHQRQTSLDSNESARDTSIEKLLKSTTSTSRPLMFNSSNSNS